MAQPHLIVYVDANFSGLHTHIFESTADFTQLALGGGSGIGGPGLYSFVGNFGIDNDSISSVKVIRTD